MDMTNQRKENIGNDLPGSPSRILHTEAKQTINVLVQTTEANYVKKNQTIQTETDRETKEKNNHMKKLEKAIEQKEKELSDAVCLAQERLAKLTLFDMEKTKYYDTVKRLEASVREKNTEIEKLATNMKETKGSLEECKKSLSSEKNRIRVTADDENKSLVEALKKIESDKNGIVEEYKLMLHNEREEYLKSAQNLNIQIKELRTQLDR